MNRQEISSTIPIIFHVQVPMQWLVGLDITLALIGKHHPSAPLTEITTNEQISG